MILHDLYDKHIHVPLYLYTSELGIRVLHRFWNGTFVLIIVFVDALVLQLLKQNETGVKLGVKEKYEYC